MSNRQVYTNPTAGQQLMRTLISGCKTPVLEIKYCNLIHAFYYQNSPTVPRYSITCLVDPEEHKEFLKGIQAIEKNEKVDTIIKTETVKEGNESFSTGKVLIKFQSKELIPVYIQRDNGEAEPIELGDELARGERVMVVYDILRYTKKNTSETVHGISFKPSCIYYYPSESAQMTEAR
jgi:hypothetical protein